MASRQGASNSGDWVEETGIALVHEGQMIIPAPGSKAPIEPGGEGSGVSFFFPVEIEVVGRIDDAERSALEDGVWSRLCGALERT